MVRDIHRELSDLVGRFERTVAFSIIFLFLLSEVVKNTYCTSKSQASRVTLSVNKLLVRLGKC